MSRVETVYTGFFDAVSEVETDGGARYGYGTNWYSGYYSAG